MVTVADEAAPTNESEIGDEIPSGLSDLGEESRTVPDDEELLSSSKVFSFLLLFFCRCSYVQ